MESPALSEKDEDLLAESPSKRRASSSSLLSALSPASSSHDLNVNRARSSTTSVFLNFINNGSGTKPEKSKKRKNIVSLYRLLLLELNLPSPKSIKTKSQNDRADMNKAYEQLSNMVKVPIYLEKFIAFGLLVCVNSFLNLFTLVPLKIGIVSYSAFKEYFSSPSRDLAILTRKLRFVKRDLITLLLIVSCVFVLTMPMLGISRLYHDIRGQAHIKLYVMFGVLEVTDKLLSSIAQEVFTVLVGLPLTNISPDNVAKIVFFMFIALVFFACHSYVLIYQSVSLHVAANSYSNALLALLLSNQFAELKGAVFKKFEREGLFQVSMSDLAERFQLSIMLFVIAIRNLSQLSATQLVLVPDSWKSWNKWFGAIFGPSVVVLGSEIFVDWVKHCFMIKFNLIRPKIYDNFLYVLSSDFMEVFTSNSKVYTSHEISDYTVLTKRIGLPMISLTVCFLRMTLQDSSSFYLPSSFTISSIISSVFLVALTAVVLLVLRLLISLWLLKWARRIKHKHEAWQEFLKHISSDSVTDSIPTELEPSHFSIIEEKTHSKETSTDPTYQFPDYGFQKDTHGKHESEMSPRCTVSIAESEEISPIESDIRSSFLPGIPNTESSSINPRTRSHLYDFGEAIPPTLEEKRNAQLTQRGSNLHKDLNSMRSNDLHKVHRYEMSSKRIW